MAGGAQLSVPDMRGAARHPVDYTVVGEHRVNGDVALRVTNLSAHGFMIEDASELARGDRVIIRLPVIGRIEAYCIWLADTRAGFQFERIIRFDDFVAMIEEIQPSLPIRRRG